MSHQLSIDFGRSRVPGLAEFMPGKNDEPLQAVRSACLPVARTTEHRPQCIHLWGEAGVGKTHLLRAACMEVHSRGLSTAYLSSESMPPGPAELSALAEHALLCIDGLDHIAGDYAWEVAMYDLYERIRERGSTLLSASRSALTTLPLRLPDLKSRLGWGLVYHLEPLGTDDERLAALMLRAHTYAFALPEDAGRYLLQHFPRDMPTLCKLLERIDNASLASGRRVTRQFVYTYLEKHSHTVAATPPGP